MHLITFSQPRLAQAFVDYMATQHILLRQQAQDEGIALYLDDESHIATANAALAHFLANPTDPRYLAASWQQGKVSSSTLSFTSLTDMLHNPSIRLTILIALMAIAVYLLTQLTSTPFIFEWLGFPENSSEYGQLWRWITPIFIHFSLLHLVMNLFWWYLLGRQVETIRGKRTLIEIVLLSSLLSNAGQAAMSTAYFGGLSGVAYALIGYTWLTYELTPRSGIRLDRGLASVAIIWLLLGYTPLLSNIANSAHLIGLIVGLALALVDMWRGQHKIS